MFGHVTIYCPAIWLGALYSALWSLNSSICPR